MPMFILNKKPSCCQDGQLYCPVGKLALTLTPTGQKQALPLKWAHYEAK